MIYITLFGDRVLSVSDDEGQQVDELITSAEPPKYIKLAGQTILVGDITGIFTGEQFEDMRKGAAEPVAIPKPLAAVDDRPVPDGYTRHETGGLTRPETAWKREAFAEWGKRNGKFEVGSGKKLFAFPQSEAEYTAWRTGIWPKRGEDGR